MYISINKLYFHWKLQITVPEDRLPVNKQSIEQYTSTNVQPIHRTAKMLQLGEMQT